MKRSEDSGLLLRASPHSDQKDVRRSITEKSEKYYEMSNFPAYNLDIDLPFNVVKSNQFKDKIPQSRQIPDLLRLSQANQ